MMRPSRVRLTSSHASSKEPATPSDATTSALNSAPADTGRITTISAIKVPVRQSAVAEDDDANQEQFEVVEVG
jgi:hypothetical protein